MSVSDCPLPVSASDDIWHQNKAEIRNLYQNKRKTLKEVKQLMELKGFPETPLSTWETKVRDVLQLRKKAKATNWPLIYQHVLPRLEKPGQKELRRRTAIYLNGSEIPWNKAWKEMRRSRATAMPLRQKSPSPLPFGIVIRTPSPVPGPSTPTDRASHLMGDVVATHFEHSAQDIILRHYSGMEPTAQAAFGDDTSESLAQKAVSAYQHCAATIPWVELYQALQYLFYGAHAARRLDGHLYQEEHELPPGIITNSVEQVRTHKPNINFQSCFDLLPANYPIPPRPSHDLGCRVSISAARLQLNQFISTAMYLLSNRLHDPDDGDKGLEVFCSILERDARQTIELLHSRRPSIRAAWNHLLRYSADSHRRDTFRLLIDIGIRNSWLDSRLVPLYFKNAVKMDCNDTVKDLVTYGSRSSSDWWTETFDAIIAAVRNGNNECVRLLVKNYSLNVRTWWDDPGYISEFQAFIHDIDIHNDSDVRALDFLLAIGTNIDKPFGWGEMEFSIKRHYGNDIDHFLRLTTLDRSFYFDRPLYEKLKPYSKVSASEMSRSGILLALESGTLALQEYLVARVTATPLYDWQRVHSYLELILAEQFMLLDEDYERYRGVFPRDHKEINLETVRGLVQYGVDLTLPSMHVGIQDLLGAVLRQLSRRCTDDGLELISILMANGASMTGPQLRVAVEDHGFIVLECLALLVEDFPAKAVLALAEAARLNNFEAVEFLLRAGVDPCSFISSEDLGDTTLQHSSYSIQAIAAQAERNGKRGGANCDMIKCLVEHGARLVVTPNEESPFDFIRHLLRYGCFDTLSKVKYAIQVLRNCNSISVLPPDLLESCLSSPNHHQPEEERKGRLEAFEYFLGQGASVSPGSCLAALICAGGPEQLVEKVVLSGADLNAYYHCDLATSSGKFTPLQAAARSGKERLVRLLLRAGSEVNSRACGKNGKTALQAICSWDSATEEEYDRKMRICQLLISHGANTNAEPARVWGSTALQLAASIGHLEIAALLLRNGAHVNAPGCGRIACGHTCLDYAVIFSRLDMVKFLLNANALSDWRGTTGYYGAISLAMQTGNLAIADLIREHAANNVSLGLINPELLKPQEDYHIYGYVTDKIYDIDSYGCNTDDGTPAVWREHCTMDSLCRYCSGRAPGQESLPAQTVRDPF